MRILFIVPPNFRFRRVVNQHISWGPAFLTAVLKKDHDVLYYGAEAPSEIEAREFAEYTSYDFLKQSHSLYIEGLSSFQHPVWKEVGAVIKNFSPDVVGISTMTSSYPSALMVARIVKKISSATVLMGGVHPSILHEEVAANDDVDYVVRGEAENTILDLIQNIERGLEPEGVRGLTYRRNGAIVKTPDRDPIRDLDSIHYPDTSTFLYPERYTNTSYSTIIAARGCPAQCHFCSNLSLWGGRYRSRSAENIFNQLQNTYEKYQTPILFLDDNLLFSKKFVVQLCDLMNENTPDLLWRCQSRVDTITEEKLSIIKDAGCWSITLGIESGSDNILSYINKRLTVEKAMRCFEEILNAGIQLSVNFMFGFPEETWNDMKATLEFIKKIPAHNIAISKFIPLPGTKLYNDVLELGLIEDSPPKYEHLDLFSTHYHFAKNVPRDKFYEFFLEIHRIVDEKNKKTRIGHPSKTVVPD